MGWLLVHHFDAYRLRDEVEFNALGPEEYFDGCGVTFEEWADRVANSLLCDNLEIHIEVAGKTARCCRIVANSTLSGPIIRAIQKSLSS